jgi:hypothetical protein
VADQLDANLILGESRTVRVGTMLLPTDIDQIIKLSVIMQSTYISPSNGTYMQTNARMIALRVTGGP